MSAMTTQEKIEEFWGKCFHPATKVVYTTDHYKVGKEEFISIVSGFINQAIIEELDEALLSVNYFSRQKNLNDKEVMLSVTRYLRGRIKTFKEEL